MMHRYFGIDIILGLYAGMDLDLDLGL
jgi:hypothetical protein